VIGQAIKERSNSHDDRLHHIIKVMETQMAITTIENSKRNRAAVLALPVLAKATIRSDSDGKVYIIVVFAQSTKHEFYWIFRSRSARSARKTWKFVNYNGRDFSLDYKPYYNFETFVAYYARTHQGQVSILRLHQRRKLAALLAKTAHESIHSDWTPKIASTDPRDYQKVNRAFERNIDGRHVDFYPSTPRK
jgi:hypothetical protein